MDDPVEVAVQQSEDLRNYGQHVSDQLRERIATLKATGDRFASLRVQNTLMRESLKFRQAELEHLRRQSEEQRNTHQIILNLPDPGP